MRWAASPEEVTDVSLSPVEGDANARSSAAVPVADPPNGTATAPLGGDPRPDMPPSAVKILAAAQRVLVAKGFSGLTLRAIAQESGMPPCEAPPGTTCTVRMPEAPSFDAWIATVPLATAVTSPFAEMLAMAALLVV